MNGKTRGDYRIRHGCLLGDDGRTAGFVGQSAGQPETAGQVRDRLHGLIRAGQLNRCPAQPGLKRQYPGGELAGRRHRPHLQRGAEQRPGIKSASSLPTSLILAARRSDGLARYLRQPGGWPDAGRARTHRAGPGGCYDLLSPGKLVVAALAGVQAG